MSLVNSGALGYGCGAVWKAGSQALFLFRTDLVKLVWKMGAGLQISKKTLKIQSCSLGESRAFLEIDAVIRSTESKPSTLRNPWPPAEGILRFRARL